MTALSPATPLLVYGSRALTRSIRSPYMRSIQDVGRTLRLCLSNCVAVDREAPFIAVPWGPSLSHVEPDAVAALAGQCKSSSDLYIGYAYSVHAPGSATVGGLAARSISPFVYCGEGKMFSSSAYTDALEWAIASLSHTFKSVLMPKIGNQNA